MTRLCLAQKTHLASVLAGRGVACRTVVIADDGNLDVAAEFGCDVVEQRNVLGLKVNDGFEYAVAHGADWACFVGSDDWVHEDFFAGLGEEPADRIVAGHVIAVVDLVAGRLRRLGVRGPDGVSPWLIPRRLLDRVGGRPVLDEAVSGMEGLLRASLGRPVVFRDPHDLVRVDFKTPSNMTPYGRISRLLGYGNEQEPWPVLAERYPAALVAEARLAHLSLVGEAVAA